MKLVRLGIFWFILFLLIATFFKPEGYNSLVYTMSELAHQGYGRAYILLIGFYGNGLFFIAAGYQGYKNKNIDPSLYKSLMLSGLSIIGLGLFQTNYDYYGIRDTDNIILMYLHIVFAVINHIIGYKMVLFHIQHSHQKLKKIHIWFLIINILFVAIFVFTPIYRGLFQRILFIIGGIWFWFYFNLMSFNSYQSFHKKNKS